MSQGFYYSPPQTTNDITISTSSVPTRPLHEFVYPEPIGYYRDYSFVDRLSIIDPHLEDSLEKRKQDVLDHKQNSSRYTKNQVYRQIATGGWRYRKIYGNESSSTNKSNPNVHNLIRVDANKNVINEMYVDVIPDIMSTLPRPQQSVNVRDIVHYDTMIKTSDYTKPEDKTSIYFPLVTNRIYPQEPTILDGGILYSGTKFDPTVDRELQVPKDYKIRERVIIEESLAEMFAVNAVDTYTEEEIKEAYGKSVRDVYSYMSSWERQDIISKSGIYFSTVADQYYEMASQGPHLPSTYIAGNYDYDETGSYGQYDGHILRIFHFVGDTS
jgi:hypothetical protein